MKNKSFKKSQKGSGCSVNQSLNIKCNNEIDVSHYKCPCDSLPIDKHFSMKGGCQGGTTDCLGNTIELLGSSPTCNSKVAEAQSVSENAFSSRYCCGYNNAGSDNYVNSKYHIIQNGGNKEDYYKTTVGELFKNAGDLSDIILHYTTGKLYTEGFEDEKKLSLLQNFLIKNGIYKKNIEIGTYSTGGKNLKFTQKGGKSFKNIQNGGEGYYLAINECPIGGLPPVKSYQTCNKTITKQCLQSIKGGSKKIKNKKNQKGGEGYRLALDECLIGGLPAVKSYQTCDQHVTKCLSTKHGGSKKLKKQKGKQNGGEGYYLAVNECPIGGLPPVKSYPTCNKSIGNKCSSSASGGSKKNKKHKK